MSLIHEALDKAGGIKSPQPEPTPTTSTTVIFQDLEASLQEIHKPEKSKVTRPIKSVHKKSIKYRKEWIWVAIAVFLLIIIRFVPEPGKSAPANNKNLVSAPLNSKQSSLFSNRENKPIEFRLTGITRSGEQRLAIINDQVIPVGARLKEGATLTAVSEHTAILEYEGKQIKLSF